MQTNPESAAVEAVAWAMTDYQADGANTQFTRDRHAAEYWGEQGIQIEPLYPQSALDALRGEVAENEGVIRVWRRRCEEAERRVAELETALRNLRDAFIFRQAIIASADTIEKFDFADNKVWKACDEAKAALTKESP